MTVSRETTAWAMRILLGTEPGSDAAIEEVRQGHATLDQLRTALLERPDVKAALGAAPGTPGGHGGSHYAAPIFLLRRPEAAEVPWRFEPPSLAEPVSQLCTAAQMRQPEYLALKAPFEVGDGLHRKFWEFAFIISVLRSKGVLAPGCRGLGFGVGQEPLPAIFAAAGAEVVATDMPPDMSQAQYWIGSAQWTDDLEKLWRPNVIGREDFFSRVSLQVADMNAISPELRGFDFNWSSSCMDHLGSLRKGLDFLHNSLETLRPGGVAVHTTEFNIDSNEVTLETPLLSFFRKQDFETVFAELIAAGHTVAPLNTWPGTDPEDEHVDAPPYGLPHLKLNFGGHRTTSIGLVIVKAGDRAE